jgi:hypothetical protein
MFSANTTRYACGSWILFRMPGKTSQVYTHVFHEIHIRSAHGSFRRSQGNNSNQYWNKSNCVRRSSFSCLACSWFHYMGLGPSLGAKLPACVPLCHSTGSQLLSLLLTRKILLFSLNFFSWWVPSTMFATVVFPTLVWVRPGLIYLKFVFSIDEGFLVYGV